MKFSFLSPSSVSILATSIFLLMATLPTPAIGADAASPRAHARILSETFPDADSVAKVLTPRENWMPFPPLSDRDAWENRADQETLAAAKKLAEAHLDYPWPTLTATLSLAISRTGNRTEFEAVHFGRRRMLAAFMLAELAENRGRFLDQIINGVWAICEESFWGVSAHTDYKTGGGLVEVGDPRVDLFAAETAANLAWADYFFAEKFDAVSPRIRQRITSEISRRVLVPLSHDDANIRHRWRGGPGGEQRPNNWNPWICSNWLTAALLTERDERRRVTHVAKIIKTLDNYIAPFPADGGCDEGPIYWDRAAGSLYDNFALLNLATNDAFRFALRDEKIRNMARFIYRAHIAGNRLASDVDPDGAQDIAYVINFADASPLAKFDGAEIFRFGRDIGDTDMAGFGAAFARQYDLASFRANFARNFYTLFLRREIAATPPRLPLLRDVWLPDLQVAAARENGDSARGFYFAAKGGDNNESHNHNDIGNVIVFHDGRPLLIDVGKGEYTAQTFSERRYEIWNLCSDYHNTPTINGVTQKAGAEFAARDARFETDNARATFSCDIATAYPREAGVAQWKREITLVRTGKDGPAIIINDDVSLTKTESVVEHFMTCHDAKVTGDGEVTIFVKPSPLLPSSSATADGANVRAYILRIEGAPVEAHVEKIPLKTESDEGVKKNWGDTIRRINFRINSPAPRVRLTITVTGKTEENTF